MVSELRPRVPFAGWPRHWVRPEYGFVWIVEDQPALVTQCVVEHAANETLDALHDVLDEIVERGFLAANPGLIVLHDWRSIRTHDPSARETWSRRSRRRGKAFHEVGTSYIAVSAGSIMRMTIQTAALAVQLATGQPPIRMIDDPNVALEKHGIRAPVRDSVSRLRAAKPTG